MTVVGYPETGDCDERYVITLYTAEVESISSSLTSVPATSDESGRVRAGVDAIT